MGYSIPQKRRSCNAAVKLVAGTPALSPLRPLLLISGVKAYRFCLWGLGYEIVQGDDNIIYTLVVLFNVKHKELAEFGNLIVCCALRKRIMAHLNKYFHYLYINVYCFVRIQNT